MITQKGWVASLTQSGYDWYRGDPSSADCCFCKILRPHRPACSYSVCGGKWGRCGNQSGAPEYYNRDAPSRLLTAGCLLRSWIRTNSGTARAT